MGSVKLKLSKRQKNTPISNIFIDSYMPAAHPTYVTVYILGLRYCYSDKDELTISNIAETLSILESDVIRAWRYWNDMGIIELHEDKEEQQYSIEYLELHQETKSKKVKINEKTKDDIKTPEQNETPPPTVILETRPTYSPQELDFYNTNNADVRNLFKSAERYLGKLLSYNDMNLIFSFHDWLRLPIEVIDILFNYCTSNNHRNMRYIEKVAIEWAEKQLNTVEAANSHIKLYNTDFREIMKSFGISNRDPAPSEVELMTKWLKVYKFPLELIAEACKKAVLQTGQTNFPYTDSIVTAWYNNNISTLEEVTASEENFNKKKQVNQTKKPEVKKATKNKFVNYEQRDDWNFDELEKLEEGYIDRKLEE